MNDNILVLSDAALAALMGMMSMKAATPPGCSAPCETIALARLPPVSSMAWACAGSTPAPGTNRLETVRAITTAIDESRIGIDQGLDADAFQRTNIAHLRNAHDQGRKQQAGRPA